MPDPADRNPGDPVPPAPPLSEAEAIPVARPIASDVAPDPTRHVHDVFLNGYRVRSAWVDIVSLILLLVLFELVAATVFGFIADGTADASAAAPTSSEGELPRAMLPIRLGVRAIGAVAIVLLMVRFRRQRVASIGLERARLTTNLLIGVVVAPLVYGVGLLVMLPAELLFPELREQMAENVERIMALVPNLHPAGFTLLAILVGVYEEVVFRGFLMTRLRRATGSWTAAVLLSTALFTALHAGDQVSTVLFALTGLSLVFSVVTIWRCSIVPAIVTHALWDLVQFLMLHYWAGGSWT